MIDKNLPSSGLPLIFVSYTNKISFLLYSLNKKKLFRLFDVEREDIKEFKVVNNQNFQAISFKGKRIGGVNSVGLGTILGTAVPIVGPLIGGAIGYSISKLKGKMNENHVYNTFEITGSIFQLICSKDNKNFTITIACMPLYAKEFELVLQKHWSVNSPTIQKI